MLEGGCTFGSSPESGHHTAVMSVGMNWGLFDTIDVLKYSTKDTLHYPTSLLNAITQPYLVATEQLPVNGVPFPDIQNKKMVSRGIVEGTAIGYIYAWDWAEAPGGATRALFAEAVDELVNQQKVQGLILDFRTNGGGWPAYANDGYKHLFNFDPTLNYSLATRVRGGPHLSFTEGSASPPDAFSPGPELFDHPIAVLTGPHCASAGDYNAFKMRFHPMARFFGKRTNGAYTAWTARLQFGVLAGPYFCRVDDASVYSNFNNEGFMIHKGFPVDEEVWLTRDGVAKGEDDVVKRALEWISTLTYAHEVACNRGFARPGMDTVRITARVANPLNHSTALSAIVTDNAGVVYDSLQMSDDGTHGDRVAGDSVWSCQIRAPLSENLYGVAIRTEDLTQGTFRRLPSAVGFTTARPVCIGDTTAQAPQWGIKIGLRLKVTNRGSSATITAVKGTISSLDTAATISSGSPFSVGDIAPGQVRLSSPIVVSFSPWVTGSRVIPFELVFSSNGIEYPRDTLMVDVVTGVGEAVEPLPKVYTLDQNYPNPFNPNTTIRYGLPSRSHVVLTVYNTLGQQVATLVQGEQEAGYHEAVFDAVGLASGVYLYRLQAGDFIQTRKFVLLK
jgi:hypothetical protein